jgi:hypothetical protein
MPNRWPISSGNWSDSAIWSGSIIPTASDDVYANSQSIYIDTDITVLTLRNAAITGVTQGGIFYLNNGVNVNLTGIPAMFHTGPSVFAVTNTPLVIISGSNSATITGSLGATSFGPKIHLQENSNLFISGNLTATTNTANIGIRHSSTGNLVITGSVSGSTAGSSHAVYIDGNGFLYILGNVNGGSGNPSAGIEIVNSCSISIIGNVTGGTNTGATAIRSQANGGIINIQGNVIGGVVAGGSGSPPHGILNSVISKIIITGSVIGRLGDGINNTGISEIYVSGSVESGNLSIAGSGFKRGISSTTNGIISVIGSISSSDATNGIQSTSTTATNLFTGPFYNTGSYNAVYAYRMQMLSTSSQWTFDTETAGVSKTLYTSNQLPGVPQQTDVRKGTTYNFGLTGSLEMPDPTTVKTGVSVDNTTGSAILTAQDLFDVATQTLTDSGSIGNLLTGASTVQTVGATISSFKV